MSPEIHARRLTPEETVPQGPANVVVFEVNSASPADLEKKNASLNQKIFVLMAARAEVAIIGGQDQDLAKRRLGSDFESFMDLPLGDKKSRYAELREELEKHATRPVFLSVLDAYGDIAKDSSNGPMDDLVRLDVENKKREFDQSSLPSKLLLTAKLRIETQDMLVQKFPIYLSFWEDVSKKNGKTQENIDAEIAAMQEKFDHASERGKAGISRDLRGRIETADLTRFQAYWEMYGRLYREKGIPPQGTEDLPTPESFSEIYMASDLKRKAKLLFVLESKTHILLSY
jgi:hypothetical protein